MRTLYYFMEKEIWKKLYAYDGYEVSSWGNIRSLDREVITVGDVVRFVKGEPITPRNTKKNGNLIFEIRFGYDKANKKYKRRTLTVARCVADHFVKRPKTDESLFASNLDGDYNNNHFTNVVWLTQSEIVKKQSRDYSSAWDKRKKNKR